MSGVGKIPGVEKIGTSAFAVHYDMDDPNGLAYLFVQLGGPVHLVSLGRFRKVNGEFLRPLIEGGPEARKAEVAARDLLMAKIVRVSRYEPEEEPRAA